MATDKKPIWERTRPGIHAETKLRDRDFVMAGHHCHTCFELFYVQSGACRFLVDESLFDLVEGDFILIPPLALHYTRYLFGPCKRTVVRFQKDDIGEASRRFMPREEGFFTGSAVFSVPREYRDRVAGCLGHMSDEEALGDDQSLLMRQLSLQWLFLLCSRVCAFREEPSTDLKTTDEQILRAAHFISSHYMNPLTTQDVAASVGFSPNYLSRRFRQEAGVGLHEYLVFIRLHHAALELVSTEDSITDIAFRCGFSDSNYFKDAFKKKYGVTPREYRKMM